MLMFHLLYEFRVASGFVLETVSNSRIEWNRDKLKNRNRIGKWKIIMGKTKKNLVCINFVFLLNLIGIFGIGTMGIGDCSCMIKVNCTHSAMKQLEAYPYKIYKNLSNVWCPSTSENALVRIEEMFVLR